jgi:hypothetical protein
MVGTTMPGETKLALIAAASELFVQRVGDDRGDRQ